LETSEAGATLKPQRGSQPFFRTIPETVWPRSAQRAAAVLVGLSVVLLAGHTYGYLRWCCEPTELQRNGYRIDLNHTDRAELLQVPGVGESLVQRIQEHGAFASTDELSEVRGVGPATLAALKPWVQAGSQEGVAHRTSSGKKESRSSSAGSRKPNPGRRIDINKATPDELQELPSIGPRFAERIIAERLRSPFKSVDDLRRVKGIGPKKLEQLRPFVTVQSPVRLITRID
jgi:competence protein ComEA